MNWKRFRKPVAIIAALSLVIGLFPAYAVADNVDGGVGGAVAMDVENDKDVVNDKGAEPNTETAPAATDEKAADDNQKKNESSEIEKGESEKGGSAAKIGAKAGAKGGNAKGASEDKEISSVTFSLTPPVAGDSSDSNPIVTVSGEGIGSTSAGWESIYGYGPPSDTFTFEEGRTYYVCASVKASDGYVFKQGTQITSGAEETWYNFDGTCTVSGGDASLYKTTTKTFEGDGSYLRIWVQVTATASSAPAAETLSFHISSDGNGKVNAVYTNSAGQMATTGSTLDATFEAKAETEVTLYTVPDSNYYFSSWYMYDYTNDRYFYMVSDESEVTFTATPEEVVTDLRAKFANDAERCYISGTDGGGVRIDYTQENGDTNYMSSSNNVNMSCIIKHNTQVTLTATPKDGNVFEGWYDFSGDTLGDCLSTSSEYTFTFTESTHVRAVFAEEAPAALSTIWISDTDGVMNNGGGFKVSYTTEEGTPNTDADTVYRSNKQIISQGGTEVTVTAVPDSGYELDGWYRADMDAAAGEPHYKGEAVATGTTFTYTDNPMGAGDPSPYVVAVFKSTSTTHTVSFDMGENGASLCDAPDQQTVGDGEKAEEPTTPAKGDIAWPQARTAFEGWYTQPRSEWNGDLLYNDEDFDFDTAITTDTTLYAAFRDYINVYAVDATMPSEYKMMWDKAERYPELVKVKSVYEETDWGEHAGTFAYVDTPITVTAREIGGWQFKGWAVHYYSEGDAVTKNDAIISTDKELTTTFDSTKFYYAIFQPTDIEEVQVGLTVPEIGDSAANLETETFLSIPADAPYVIKDFEVYESKPEYGWDGITNEPFTGTFEAGKTYYAWVLFVPDDAYYFMQGGGVWPNTQFTVTEGGTSLHGPDLGVSNYWLDDNVLYCTGEGVIAFTIPDPLLIIGYQETAADPNPAGVSNLIDSVTIAGDPIGLVDDPEVSGGYLSSTPIPAGSSVTIVITPTDKGMVASVTDPNPSIDDWNVSVSTDGVATITFTMPGEDTNLTAILARAVSVIYDANGGTPAPETQVIEVGGYATKPANPTKEGFGFQGWYEKEPAELTRADIYSNWGGFNFANTAITDDLTLHAAWYADFKGYTYDITDPDNPVASVSYSKGGNVTWTSSYQISSYPVTAWDHYSTIQESEVTITANPFEGYEFVCWALNAKPAANEILSTSATYTFTFDGEMTIYGLFQKATHTVSFDTGEGDTVQPQTVAHGGYATAPTDVKWGSYSTMGWHTAADPDTSFNFSSTPIMDDVVLYPNWVLSTWAHAMNKDANYSMGGGTVKRASDSLVPEMPGGPGTTALTLTAAGSPVSFVAEAAEGFEFVGWTAGTSPTGTIISTEETFSFTAESTSPTQLFAIFQEKTNPTLTVDCSINSGNVSDAISSVTVNGTALTLSEPDDGLIRPNPTVQGKVDIAPGEDVTVVIAPTDNYTVLGYSFTNISEYTGNMAPDGTTTITFKMPEENAGVSASLARAASVEYDANGGTPTLADWPADNMVKLPMSIAAMGTPIDADYFSGMVTPPTGLVFAGLEVTHDSGTSTVDPGDTLSNAKFANGGKIKWLWGGGKTVTFDENGGSGTMDPAQVAEGAEYKLPKCDFNPPYTYQAFDKWSVKIGDADAVEKNPDDTITVSDDTTVTALWKDTATVSVLVDGPEAGIASIEINGVESTLEQLDPVPVSSIEVVATPAEGYMITGIVCNDVTSGTPVKYKEGNVDNGIATLTMANVPAGVYSVEVGVEKMPTVTIHWSSMDGVDKMVPIVIEGVPVGSTVAEALAKIGGADRVDELFAKDGYKALGWFTSKPITEFSDYDALGGAEVKDSAVVAGDMDLYYGMLTEIDGTAEATIEVPVCGTEVTTPGGDRNKQTNAPQISTPDGVNYSPDTAKGYLPAWWMVSAAEPYTPFEGTIKGGQAYYAGIWLAADYGYVFASDSIAVDGAEVIKPWSELDGRFVGAAVSVEVEHEWGEWTVVKEATEEADGLEQRTCKHCDAAEEKVIPKIVVEYRCVAGDGATYTIGSGKALAFIFKRNVNDDKTFPNFTGALLDGKLLSADQYDAKAGSVMLTLGPSLLDTLAPGKHTLTAQFTDGEATANFTVEAAKADSSGTGSTSKSSSTPATGDTVPVGAFALTAVLAAAVLVISRRLYKA